MQHFCRNFPRAWHKRLGFRHWGGRTLSLSRSPGRRGWRSGLWAGRSCFFLRFGLRCWGLIFFPRLPLGLPRLLGAGDSSFFSGASGASTGSGSTGAASVSIGTSSIILFIIRVVNQCLDRNFSWLWCSYRLYKFSFN